MEEQLVTWIIAEDRAGQAPGYTQVCAMAEEMLLAACLPTGLREKWHSNFTQCHETIRDTCARKIELDRITTVTLDAIKRFFDQYEELIQEYKIPPSNHYNMDESRL